MAKYIPLSTVENIKEFLTNSDAITQYNADFTKNIAEYRKGQYSILDWLLDDLEGTMVEMESEE